MTWPYLLEECFEDGTSARFDGTGSNGNSKLNVRHYSWLASRLQYPDAVPYRGAYALHCDLSLGTADAYIQSDTQLDLAASDPVSIRFYFQATRNLTMAASDRFSIFQLQSAGPVSEASIDIRNNAGVYQILASETGAAATVRATDLILDVWHCVEIAVLVDSGGGDGTVTFYLDGYPIGAAIGTLTQAAVAQARLGALNIDAGTTAGHLLFDQFVGDDTRVFPLGQRYPHAMTLTQSGHVGVGRTHPDLYLHDWRLSRQYHHRLRHRRCQCQCVDVGDRRHASSYAAASDHHGLLRGRGSEGRRILQPGLLRRHDRDQPPRPNRRDGRRDPTREPQIFCHTSESGIGGLRGF